MNLKKRKKHIQSPLPFQGQKRKFLSEFKQALNGFQNVEIIVDLFGGSGLLSNAAKEVFPSVRVIYNDFDDYHIRLANIAKTNALLRDIRTMINGCPKEGKITEEVRAKILQRIELEKGFVDYITLSSSLLFSAKYVTTMQELKSQTFYNTVKLSDYDLAKEYLNGVEIVKYDYRELFERYRHFPNVVFLVDPPYLSTDCSTYNASYWRLSNYLDVVSVLWNNSFFYFTSNKSGIVELFDWISKNFTGDNPFKGATMKTTNNTLNHHSAYTDIMLYKEVKRV
jgi:adenine-specific DNA methylase